MPSEIRLILSGGFANGAYQFGALKYLYENKDQIRVKEIVATSVGCLNAASFISHSMTEAEEFWMKQDFKGVREFYSKMNDTDLLDKVIEVAVKNIQLHRSRTNLHITVTSVPEMKSELFLLNDKSKDEIEKLLLSAVSVPKLMKPGLIKGKYYYDGAMRANVPLKHLNKFSKEVPSVVIHFNPSSVNGYIHKYKLEHKLYELSYINQPLSSLREMFDFSQTNISTLIDQGYNEAALFFKDFNNDKVKEINASRAKSISRLSNFFYIVGKVNVTVDSLSHKIQRKRL